jgi:lysophospholipase L1-like esterase
MRKIKKLAMLPLLILALVFTGCGPTARNTEQTGPADIADDSIYKEMTGNVVVFGTSIWAIEPGPTGIASRLEEITSFKVTDNSVSGSMATRVEDDYLSDGSLISILLYNDDIYSRRMRDSIKEADYVILAFGGNDYYRGVPASGDGNSFENAMKLAVSTIKEMNPDAHIILIPPLNGWALIDGEYVSPMEIDFGSGTLGDFIDVVERVAREEDLLCVNMSEVIVFSKDEPLKYFEDGSHLTESGRMLYAQYLAERIYGYYYSD